MGRVQYDPYGEVLTSTLPADLTDRLFTGQRLDNSSGLYYYNARYYDPHLGRFIQPDSLVPDPLSPQAWNRFSYVYNNPASYVDPSGHIPAIVLVAAIGFLVGEIIIASQGYTPLDVEFWTYSIGMAATFTCGYFLAADLLLVAGIGMHGAGLWAGSTAISGLGSRFTSAGAGMYAWAFQPLDFSPRLRFYHATTTAGAENIRRIGIDPSYGRTEADFGQGFYVTRNRAQAQDWAERRAERWEGEPEVLEFRVSQAKLGSLKGLRFAGPSEAWQAFVTAHRTVGTPMHSYDFVEGPIAVPGGGIWVPHPDPTYHQLSIHTKRAVEIFWKGLLR